MKSINKLLVDQFKIGFEFEFYVKNSAIANHLSTARDNKVNKIPKEVLKQYGHLFVANVVKQSFDYEEAGKYFKDKLQEIYPNESWKKAFSVTQDGSLNDNNAITGLEVVYKHQTGSDALRNFKQILTLLQSHDFVTKSECGLHINISFKDETKNNKGFAFELIKNLDVALINEKFGRKNNEYCEDNRESSLDLDYALEDTFSSSRLRSLLIGKKSETLRNVLEGIENLKKPVHFQKFLSMIEISVKDYCIEKWDDNRPAIAPRKSSSGHYLEFRATGGKDYQHKQEDLIHTLNEYLKAMVVTNKSLTATRTKIRV